MQPNFDIENFFLNKICVGIDEAGRGPLAGPVVAASVILDKNILPEINDSKKISKIKREKIFKYIISRYKFGVGVVDAKKIDEINILEATKLAMLKSFLDLQKKYSIRPNIILVDGNFKPFEKRDEISEIKPIVKGDQKSFTIAAASIVAKVTRDNIMKKYDEQYPNYGFLKNQGYPTKFHIEKIKEFGIVEIHRKSFGPVARVI